ncbi:pleurocidin-like peptide WF4 [Pleuronectes platessa]|uniref:pleurocidin-like peptide WF4 n=1 Tax=Pleuronectes platessa TaxID=8262 RepID=UPI00232A1E8C|nr:pleurocidin-like peptide WF4 [Pleuronectes platessa]
MKFTATFLILFIFILMVDLGESRWPGRRRKPSRKPSRRPSHKPSRKPPHTDDFLGGVIGGIGSGLGGLAVDALGNAIMPGQDYEQAQGQDYEEQQELAKRSDDDSPSLIFFD